MKLNLKIHVNAVHENLRKHAGDICGFTAKHGTTLKRHMKVFMTTSRTRFVDNVEKGGKGGQKFRKFCGCPLCMVPVLKMSSSLYPFLRSGQTSLRKSDLA